jgi:hypothetical protein
LAERIHRSRGYGGSLVRPPERNSHDRHVQRALGLQTDERMLGFLYAGSAPKERNARAHAARARGVRARMDTRDGS